MGGKNNNGKEAKPMKYLKRIVIAILFLIAAAMLNNAVESAHASSGTGVGGGAEKSSNNC